MTCSAITNSHRLVCGPSPKPTTNQHSDLHLYHILHCPHVASAGDDNLHVFVYVCPPEDEAEHSHCQAPGQLGRVHICSHTQLCCHVDPLAGWGGDCMLASVNISAAHYTDAFHVKSKPRCARSYLRSLVRDDGEQRPKQTPKEGRKLIWC